MTNTIEQATNEINQFLKSDKIDAEMRFVQGYFIKLRKHIKKGLPFIEIHTSGYDDTLTASEAIDWLKWELVDRRANGFMI